MRPTSPIRGSARPSARSCGGLARGRRLIGFLLVCLGAAGLIYVRLEAPDATGLRFMSWLLPAAGWAILIAVIVGRTSYHKARMAQGLPPGGGAD